MATRTAGIMPCGLTDRQDKFTRLLFEGHSNREAWALAGYSTNYPIEDQDSHASNLAATDKVKTRLSQLIAAQDATLISTPSERRKILTEIQRARIADYLDENGNLVVKREQMRSAAVREITTERTLMGVRTTLKLHSPIPAISEHNKMDHLYETGTAINVGEIKILVVREGGNNGKKDVLSSNSVTPDSEETT